MSESKTKIKTQISKILVAAVVLVPMVVAYVIYETGVGIPTHTINKGVLLTPPQQIDDIVLRKLNGDIIKVANLDKKWRLVVPEMDVCEESCKQSLYVTRQVHTRLNEKYTRVEHLLLVPQLDPVLADYLKTEHRNLQVLLVEPQAWSDLLSATNYENGRYLMMDPEGFLMMYYQDQHTGNDLLADLKRMLKFSREH